MFGEEVERELGELLADLHDWYEAEGAQALADIAAFELDDDFVTRLKMEAEAGLKEVLDSLADDGFDDATTGDTVSERPRDPIR